MAKHCQNCNESHVKMNIPFSIWGAVPPRPPAMVIVNPPLHFSGFATVCLVRHSVNKCPHILINWTASILQCVIKLPPHNALHSSSYVCMQVHVYVCLIYIYIYFFLYPVSWAYQWHRQCNICHTALQKCKC